MSNEKYNSWQQSLREYSGSPGDFNKDAAWLRLEQRVRPQKRKRLIVLLAAACTAGFLVFLGISLIQSETNIPVTEKEAVPQKEVSPNVSSAPVKGTDAGGTSLSKELNPVPVTAASQEQFGSRKITGAEQSSTSAEKTTTRPVFAEQLPAPDTATAVQELVTVRTETVKPAAKPTMRIVHINELNSNVQTTPPSLAAEQPQQSRFPLVRSVLAQSRVEPETRQEPAPEVKQRRGLLRSMASIKEY